MRHPPTAFVGSDGQAPVSFAGSFPISHGVTESPVGSVGLSDIVDTNAAVDEVLETAINGTGVGITAFAAETGHTVEYTLPVNPGGLFAIGLTTGEVTKAAALDAETAVSHDITVRAASSSGKVKERVFSIAVNDADEFNVGAVTDVDAAANEVSESAPNGTSVGITAAATDADVTDTVTYSLFDDAGGRFAIDANTGVVTVADTGLIDFETQTSHQITVRATSSDLSEQDQNFTITVLNDAADDGLVPAVRFDGTNTVLRRAAAPTGAVDGVNGTFAIPIKMMGDTDPFDTKLQYIWSNETGSYIRRNADGRVEALFADAAGAEFAKIISTNALRVADGWTMLLVNPVKMYFGNTDETGTRTTGAATDIDWTSGFNWGEDSAGSNRANVEFARAWLALEAYDLTVQGNREAFFTALTPLALADIKTDGSGPTATQALDFLPNAYPAVSQNAGSGGNYSIVGTPREGAGPAGAALTAPASFNGITTASGVNTLTIPATGGNVDDMIYSVDFRRSTTGAETMQVSSNGGRFSIGFTADDEIIVSWNNVSGAARLIAETTSFAIKDTYIHNLTCAFHNDTSMGGTGLATAEMVVDGVLRGQVTINTIGANQFAPGSHDRIFGDSFSGDVFKYWEAAGTKVDLTQTVEQERWYNDGILDLGATGVVNGITPGIYVRLLNGGVLINDGTGSNATENGTLGVPTTDPSVALDGATILADALVWYEMDDAGNTVTANEFETVNDKNGVIDLTTAAAANRPHEVNDAGAISAEFVDATHGFVVAAASYPANAFHNGGTFFTVLRVDGIGGGGFGRLFEKGGNNIRTAWAIDLGGGEFGFHFQWGKGTGTPNWDMPNGFTSGAIERLAMQLTQTQRTSDVRQFINGVKAIPTIGSWVADDNADDDSASDFFLGNRVGYDRVMDGRIYMYAEFDAYLPAQYIAAVDAYLNTKY